MGEVKIEDNVPQPGPKWPFEDLKVNQSFTAGVYSEESQRNLVSLANYYGKKLDAKYSTGKDEDGLLRIWRVA